MDTQSRYSSGCRSVSCSPVRHNPPLFWRQRRQGGRRAGKRRDGDGGKEKRGEYLEAHPTLEVVQSLRVFAVVDTIDFVV